MTHEEVINSPVYKGLMKRYDQRFPHASAFPRGSYEFEIRKVLQDIANAGFIITTQDDINELLADHADRSGDRD